MGEKELAVAAIQNDIEPIHRRLSAAFDELVKMNVGNTNSVAESAANTFGRTLALTVSVALIGVLIIGVMGFLFGRSITGPLQSMQQAIMRTAQELDFTVPITVHTQMKSTRHLKPTTPCLRVCAAVSPKSRMLPRAWQR